MILRAYKYRIYPSLAQISILLQTFGAVRYLWNELVSNFNSWSAVGPNRPMNEKILKDSEGHEWLRETISYALQQKRMDFEEAKKQLFNKNRKTKAGRMKFKKKGVSRDSFRIPGQAVGYNKCIDQENKRIRIPKVGNVVIVIDRMFKGTVRSFTVSRNSCGQYFVSVLVEEEVELKQNTGRSIGIDLGLNDDDKQGLISLCILSNGIKIKIPKLLRESQAEMKRAQQHLNRKTKDSKRYLRQKKKVARLHQKTARQREWLLHNISTHLVNNYDHIFMEDLNVAGMKKTYGKSLGDAAFSKLVNLIEYKCLWYGRSFHKVSRWFPSSKTCSCCGHKLSKEQLTRGIRNWICPVCDTHHDRDINAAVNILNEGLKDLYGFTSDELADYKRREEVRHASTGAFLNEAFSNFIEIYRSA